jgi:hypothetical protein
MSSSPNETAELETAAAASGQHSVSVPFFFMSEFDPTSGYVGGQEQTASALPVSCNGNCTCGGKPKPETDS